MSEKKKVELLSKPKILKEGGISVKVLFNYPNGRWTGGLTVHAIDKEDFKERLKEAWESKKPRPALEEKLKKELEDIEDIDWET